MKNKLKLLLLTTLILNIVNLVYTNRVQKDVDSKFAEIKALIKHDTITVTATMYYPDKNQCDDTPLITACNYKINPDHATDHKWVAVSRNLLKKYGGEFHYGDKIKIHGAGLKDGIYTIADTMNKRFENRIDFLETTGTKNYKFENVKIVKV